MGTGLRLAGTGRPSCGLLGERADAKEVRIIAEARLMDRR